MANEIQDETSQTQQSNGKEVNEKENQEIKQTRRRSGSWGGAYESEEEIKVRTSERVLTHYSRFSNVIF